MAVPAVTAPVPAAFELTIHVTALLGLLVPVTVAVNFIELPLATDWYGALTDTPVTVGTTTETGALPDFEGSNMEVAMT